ncbi:MAG: ArsB/NhaD family transporter [Thermoleophilia bacterium]
MAELLAVGVFILAIALIATERLHRTVVALTGGAFVILIGLIEQEPAIEAVDWAVLGLLAGMMILVWGAQQTGIFTWLAVAVGRASGGRPAMLVLGLTGATALLSAFLDNVTTVLLVVPVTLVLADTLDIDAAPLVVAEVIASNIGGAATLIGDPPNIIIGSAANLGFVDFLIHVGPPAVLGYAAAMSWLYLRHGRQFVPEKERLEALASLDPTAGLGPRRDVVIVLACTGLTILGFFVHGVFHLEPATVAMSGAALFLLVGRPDIETALEGIEWTTLFFFGGLFVMVGALEVNGTLERVAEALRDVTGGNRTAEVLGIAWTAAIASGLVDNIPFTAAMVPVVRDLSAEGSDVSWWALSLGACYGGNLTLIGASANLVAAGALNRANRPLSFVSFMKYGIPATMISMAIGSLWLLLLLAVE